MLFMSRVRTAVRLAYSPKYLLFTNTVTAGVTMFAADVATQRIERIGCRPEEMGTKTNDWKRTGRLFIVGVALGPLGHFWYKFLDKTIPAVTLSAVGKKILLDQMIASPVLVVWFLLGASVMEGKSSRDCYEELRLKFVPVYLVDCAVWPAAQALNFRYIPPQYRFLWVTGINFFFDAFLSFIKHKDLYDKDEVD